MREAMANNGSPSPKFSTYEGRTYFLVELPVHPELRGVWQAGVHDGVHDLGVTERRILMALAAGPKSIAQIATELGYAQRTRNVRSAVARLGKAALVALTIPDKPRSKNQKLRITETGQAWLGRA